MTRGRLVAWTSLVLVVGGLNFAGRETSGPPGRDVLYQYATAIGGLVQYAIVLGVVLVIARGLDWREVFALRAPASLRGAAGYAAGGLATIVVVNLVLSRFLDAGREQGLVPDRWEPRHAGAFAANFAVVAVVAPVVEELTFRGLGVAAVSQLLGPAAAVAVIGIAFGLWHGLVIAFPTLAILGAVFAYVRLRTGSVYPSVVMHAVFNAAALVLAVTVRTGG